MRKLLRDDPKTMMPTEPDLQKRVIQRDRDLAGRNAPETITEEYDESYDNMTSHTDDKPASSTESNTAVRSAIQKAVLSPSQPVSIPLKTVTIKLDPVLDKKVEDHCYQTGRKKQDVVRDG